MSASALEPLPQFVFRRMFDAPRELVFETWTAPAHLARWWGPKGFTNPRCEFDARKNGRIRIDMTSPEGRVYPLVGRVVEIEPPGRLAFEASALSSDGRTVFDEVNDISFEAHGARTEVIVDVRILAVRDAAAPRYLAGMEAGWLESLERLGALIARR